MAETIAISLIPDLERMISALPKHPFTGLGLMAKTIAVDDGATAAALRLPSFGAAGRRITADVCEAAIEHHVDGQNYRPPTAEIRIARGHFAAPENIS